MGELRIMGTPGDTTLLWDTEEPETVEVARTVFDEYRMKAFLTYRQDAPHAPAEVIRTFDPEVKRIVIGAPMMGG